MALSNTRRSTIFAEHDSDEYNQYDVIFFKSFALKRYLHSFDRVSYVVTP